MGPLLRSDPEGEFSATITLEWLGNIRHCGRQLEVSSRSVTSLCEATGAKWLMRYSRMTDRYRPPSSPLTDLASHRRHLGNEILRYPRVVDLVER